MQINPTNTNIPSNLNEDLSFQAPGGSSMRSATGTAEQESGKLPSDNAFIITIQDSISISSNALSEKEKATLDELKRVDREVQQHEAAHQAAAGELFRGKSFSYRIGPDGQRYAVAGDVQIDTSSIPGNPKATISKMQKIRRAALAPSNPSSQDLRVAEAATKAQMQAEEELRKQALAPIEDKPRFTPQLPKMSKTNSSSESKDLIKSTQITQVHTQVTERPSTQRPVTTAAGMNISTLFGSEHLNSPEGRNIDISL